jgi:SAM-dependent methyltransferase
MNRLRNAEALAARVARERTAHKDSHIDDALRKYWAVFPHVFSNPSMDYLHAFYAHELGSIQNKLILEYGCGQGDFALWLLDQGATVFGIDISEFNIERCNAKARAQILDANRYRFSVMDAHETTFPDNVFDRVVGIGILHHLDLPAAMAEIDRVLKPGAKALFQEPLGDNPLLKLYRRVASIHTLDEQPLTRENLNYLTEKWNVRVEYSGLVTLPVSLLTSIVLRPYPANWLLRAATHVEHNAHRHHVLDHWNRFVVLVYEPGRTGTDVDYRA